LAAAALLPTKMLDAIVVEIDDGRAPDLEDAGT
jgi:hypothetical protein